MMLVKTLNFSVLQSGKTEGDFAANIYLASPVSLDVITKMVTSTSNCLFQYLFNACWRHRQ